MFLQNTNFSDIDVDYHLIFAFPHQCCIIENLSKSNNKTLLISGDSQMIPVISVLSYYYKKIIYLDKRKGDFLEKFTVDEPYDVLYACSKYDLDKYTNINMKKIL